MTDELFLWMAGMPARDKVSRQIAVGHKPLNHLAIAFWTLHFLFLSVEADERPR
jgi:hypothetical protein